MTFLQQTRTKSKVNKNCLDEIFKKLDFIQCLVVISRQKNTSMSLNGFWNLTKSFALTVYAATVLTPLRRLYFNGPRFFGYGFWKGVPIYDICASLTHHNSEFWKQNPTACQEIVEKDFYAIVVLVETIGYFALFYVILSFLCREIVRHRYHPKGTPRQTD